MATSEKKRVSPAGKIAIWHCAAELFSQIPKKCTVLDPSLLYILKSETFSKFARKNNFPALGVCFPSNSRALAEGMPRQDHVYKTAGESVRFHNKKIDEIRGKMDSTENLSSFEKYPTPP